MGRSNRLFGAVVVAVVAMLTFGTVATGAPALPATAALDSPTPLASCTTITEPGEYVLTQDLVADASADACLVIEVDGTVVVDGQGHSVTGGIVVETATEDGTATFDLSDATVDRIRYPTIGVTPEATGRLSNVDVGTIELINANGLTVESSIVRNDLSGWFAFDVVLRDSVFQGSVQFFENAVGFEVVGNEFEGPVVFHEYLREGYVAENRFNSSLEFLNAGGESTDVRVVNNVITLDAADEAGFEEGGVVFTHGNGIVVENNTITIDATLGAPGSGDIFPLGFNGIFLAGEDSVVRGNTITGGDNGIVLGVDRSARGTVVEGNHVSDANRGILVFRTVAGRIADNTITRNDVGIHIGAERSSDVVTNNEITENRIGVRVVSEDAQIDLVRNVIADNTEFGVENTATDGFVFDARSNYWGAATGPSSAPADDANAPFADPVTGALANGDGDAVSEGQTPGVSNVRFDAFLSTPPGDEPDEERFYQVDFVTGSRPITTLGPAESDQFYTDQGRLIRFLHGSTSTPVERTGSVTTLDENASCIQVDSFEISGDTATVRYTVPVGCQFRESVLLVSYEKAGPGWSRVEASEQRLVDSRRGTAFNPGTRELSVRLPTNTSATTATDARESLSTAIR
jgi:parallel beta-helix repeat protein